VAASFSQVTVRLRETRAGGAGKAPEEAITPELKARRPAASCRRRTARARGFEDRTGTARQPHGNCTGTARDGRTLIRVI